MIVGIYCYFLVEINFRTMFSNGFMYFLHLQFEKIFTVTIVELHPLSKIIQRFFFHVGICTLMHDWCKTSIYGFINF